MDKKKLFDLKDQVGKAKAKASELKGRKSQLIDTLKNEHGCISVNQAEKKDNKMETEIDKLENKKEKAVKELEDEYDF